jgi:hypothetical protein
MHHPLLAGRARALPPERAAAFAVPCAEPGLTGPGRAFVDVLKRAGTRMAGWTHLWPWALVRGGTLYTNASGMVSWTYSSSSAMLCGSGDRGEGRRRRI